jgi:hypothetical protein
MTENETCEDVVKAAVEKAKTCRCLICDAEADGSRGLCKEHYNAFVRAKTALPKNRRAAMDRRNVESGKILASGRMRYIRKPNPFA